MSGVDLTSSALEYGVGEGDAMLMQIKEPRPCSLEQPGFGFELLCGNSRLAITLRAKNGILKGPF
jgi:hypothetical protein